MCCGQPARRLDDHGCQALYSLALSGANKRLLCAHFRIGNDEYDRALARGEELGGVPIGPRRLTMPPRRGTRG